MTESENTTKNGGTPSMIASLLVMGLMIALILLSVSLFGGGVADGPLQVSMTLATLFALCVAYYYGFRGSLISDAIAKGINGTIGTVFVILAIGTVIGTLYLSGSVAAFVYYGVAIISPKFFFVTVFIFASVLSLLLGSSLTTVGAVGIAFVGLASIMGVNPAIAAGAAVSGAIFGNKVAKISDTANLTVATVGGLKIDEHSKIVMRTAIPTWVVSALLYLLLRFFGELRIRRGRCHPGTEYHFSILQHFLAGFFTGHYDLRFVGFALFSLFIPDVISDLRCRTGSLHPA